jgi:8-oxo-dGTP pyrophosphatase MutT (NUDIX family)
MFDKFWRQFLLESEETFFIPNSNDLTIKDPLVPDQEEPEQPKKKELLGLEAFMDSKGFLLGDYIGGGKHGAVYNIQRKKGGQRLAAKIIYPDPKKGSDPEKETKNYKFMQDTGSKLFPKVYFSEVVDVPMPGQPIGGQTTPAGVVFMEQLEPLPEDLVRKLFVSSGYRKGSAMRQRDFRLFRNDAILKNFVEQVLKDSNAVVSNNVDRISDYVVSRFKNSKISPSKSSLIASEKVGKRTFSRFGLRILAFIFDGLLKFERQPNERPEAFLDNFQKIMFRAFNRNYSRPLITTDTSPRPRSMYRGLEMFDSEGVIPEIFPEAKILKDMVVGLEKMGINFRDVHSDNAMMRPGTNDIVIVDLGAFAVPSKSQQVTEGNTEMSRDNIKEVASCIVFDNKDRILIIKRSKTDDWKPGWWDIPGGHMEEGEIPIEGATRETDEESGLTVRNLVQVETKQFPDIIKHFFATRDYDGEVYFRPNEKTGIVEHDDYKWVTIEQLEDIQNSVVPLSTVKKAMHLV